MYNNSSGIYDKYEANNVVYVNLPLILTERSTKMFRDFLKVMKYLGKYIFLHYFLVAIADLTHPLSNNRSSIGMIGCLLV